MARIYLSPPHVGDDERRLLLEAFDSNWIAPLGPHVDAFEREVAARVGVGHAAALSSGTAALHLALLVLGVGPGDEVVTSTLGFAATANAITYVGARPVFVDVRPDTWQLDPDLVQEALDGCARRGRRAKAVITVDLYGQCADHDRIVPGCSARGVPVVEDAAEALGATYEGRAAGSLGAIGVLSFNGNKIITTGGGGMLLSDEARWVEEARFLSTQARDPAPHYQHSRVGFNYRLSNLLAAVGRGQLRHLDARVAARRANFDAYRAALSDLPGVAFMPEADRGTSSRWLTCLTIDRGRGDADRERVRERLAADDVEARPVWKPLHLQPAFAGCPVHGGDVAARLFETGLCLPSGSALTEADRARVVRGVREALV